MPLYINGESTGGAYSGGSPPVGAGWARRTSEELHVYANSATGSDSNSGLDASDAKESLEGLTSLVPEITKHNTALHLDGDFTDDFRFGTALLAAPGENHPTLVIDGGPGKTVVADDGGSPWTADIATTLTIGKTGVGWTVDAYQGYMVEIVSGSEAGATRSIQGNTADTLTVNYSWASAPTAAEFRIVRPSTSIDASTVIGLAGRGYVYVQRLYFTGNYHSPNFEGGGGDTYLNMCNLVVNDTAGEAGGGHFYLSGGLFHQMTHFMTDPDTFAFLFGKQYENAGVGMVGGGGISSSGDWLILGSFIAKGSISVNALRALTFYRGSRAGCLNVGPSGGQTVTIYTDSGYATTRISDVSGTGTWGLRVMSGSMAYIGNVDISDCAGHAIEAYYGAVCYLSSTAGSSNGGAAIYAHDDATIILANTPSLSATINGISVDGSTLASDFATITGGTPLVDANRGVLARLKQ